MGRGWVTKITPVFYAAILSSAFFMSIVLLDILMEKSIAPYSRVAISHIILFFVVFIVMWLLPGGPKQWGLNSRRWQTGILLGITLGLALGMLFSFLSYGTNIGQWNVTNVVNQLKERQIIILLLSQIFLIGLSEEVFFRGILVTYLMKQYSLKLIGLHLAVIVVSVMFAGIHFYKLLFGATLGSILPFVIVGFFYGLVLGWLYQKTTSLIGPIIVHNLCNTILYLIGMGMGS